MASAFSQLGFLRAHADTQVLDGARVDPLLRVVRHRDHHQWLSHREALAHRTESAVDHDQIRLLDESLVVEKLAVKSNPIRPVPALRRRPPHDVDLEGPVSTIEHNRRAKARAREHHQHAFCRRPRRQKRKALADDRSDAPDIAAALGKRRVEARADGEIRQQTVKQVIGLLDAPELRFDRGRPVGEPSVRRPNHIRVVESNEGNAPALEGTERVDRVRNRQMRAPAVEQGRNLAGIAAHNAGKIRDRAQRPGDADAAILDAVVERLHLVELRKLRHGAEIPKAVAGGDDLDIGPPPEQPLHDGVAAGRIAQTQPVHKEENARACHHIRDSRAASENGTTRTDAATCQPQLGAAAANHASSKR